MAKAMIFLRFSIFCVAFSTFASSVRVESENYDEQLPRNYNFHYQKSGELLKAASSNVPYVSHYEIEENDYQPGDYAEAESANFGTYDIGSAGGQYLGNGYQGGFQGGYQGGLQSGIQSGLQGGIQGGHGLGGLNQFGNLGYSGHGGGIGIGGLSGAGGIGIGGLGAGGIGAGGIGAGGIGAGGIGAGGIGAGGLGVGQQQLYSGGGGYVQGPYLTGGLGHQGGQVSGGFVDKNQFESAKKNSGDENLAKIQANAGSTASQGSQGVTSGVAQQSSAKGDTGFYKDETANKNQAGDGKQYQGAQNYDKSGKQGDAENNQKSHKKGHVTKGFKSSHRKDEEEKTETFYDEAHDEADRKNFGQNQGSFGENTQASFKGGEEKEILDSKAQGKEGHFNSQNKIDDSKAKKDEFGQKAFKDNAEQLHKVNGLGAQTILGQQESSGEYHSKKPYGILPIHSDK